MRVYFVFIILAIACSAFAQPGFQQLYGGHNQEIGVNAVAGSDGIYFFGATTSSGAGQADIVLLKVDFAGQILWAKTYGGAFYEAPDYMVRASDGGLVVVGSATSYNTNHAEELLFFKTDSMGTVVWQKVFPSATRQVPTTLIRTADNGYAITGISTVNGYGHVVLIRTNSNGDTLFTRLYGSNLADDFGVGLTQSADGGFVIVGKTWTNTIGYADMMIMKVSSNGTMQWSKSYGRGGWDEAEAITRSQDGNYLVCGATNSIGVNAYDVLVWKFDTAGNYMWGNIYGGSKEDASYSIIENRDRSIVVSGYTNSMGFGHSLTRYTKHDPPPTVMGDDSTNIFLMKTDASGDTIWTETYGNLYQDEAFHFDTMPGGGYLIPAFSDSYTKTTDSTQMLLIRTDSMGYSSCHEQRSHPFVVPITYLPQTLPYVQISGMPVNIISLTTLPFNVTAADACLFNVSVPSNTNESLVSVFPNPFTDKLVVHFTEFKNENAVVSIFTTLGDIVYSCEIKMAETRMDLSLLQRGSYLIQLKTNNRILNHIIVKI